LTQPASTALLVFEALGLGLALPFMVLSLVPAWRRLLPRPGPWMERLKQALAFPLYASVAWLVWVVSRQAGPDGVALVLIGLLLIGFAAWLHRAPPAGSSRARRPAAPRRGALVRRARGAPRPRARLRGGRARPRPARADEPVAFPRRSRAGGRG